MSWDYADAVGMAQIQKRLERRVLQREPHGCGVACVAMVLAVSYEDARKLWGKRTFTTAGMGLSALDRRLAHAGYGVQRIYKRPGYQWPPSPWALLHICMVDTDKKLPAGGRGHHFVIMDAAGRVKDPEWSGTRTLRDYVYVHNVAAIFRLKVNGVIK